MSKYLVLYKSPISAGEKMNSMTPEEKQAEMGKWMQWAESCGESLTDMGAPLGLRKEVSADGASDSSSAVNGYSMLEADDMDSALALMEGHPHLSFTEGSTIEVLEGIDMSS